jgi:hypothetical protein
MRMLKQLTVIAACVSMVALAGTVQAQESATLLLKSGERVSGQLIDLGGSDFTLRVNGQERRVPVDQVAVVDLTGQANSLPSSEASKAESGGLIVLRNGQTINGRLYDIAGANSSNFTVNTADGQQRQLNASEVSRIYFARPPNDAVATSGTGGSGLQPGEAGGITVPGNRQWTRTGITVQRGETVRFNTTGEIQLSTDSNDIAGSAGSKTQRYAQRAPLPTALAGALIGRVGNSAPFPIGNMTSVTMPAAGELLLGINDDEVGDNSGSFSVQVNAASGARRRR